MFIQVIKGKVRDRAAVEAALDQWLRDLRPSAIGFLGSTGGFTDDGQLVNLARFESAEAAAQNSERPEQAAWFEEMAKAFDGEPEFRNCTEVITYGNGGSDDAGFVQIMEGRIADLAKAREIYGSGIDDTLAQDRPDVMGGVVAVAEDGSYTEAVYFTSEAEARANEGKEPSEEAKAMMAEWEGIFTVDRYIDLHEPMLY
jgi:hypothetical protein